MMKYLDPMLRYRPDLSMAYGILAVKENFTIFKLDAFGLHHLEESSWDSTIGLQQFVAAVYYASETRNSTLDFVPRSGGLWRMKVEENTFHMYPFYAGCLRRTWVAAGYRSDDGSRRSQPLIFKLSWGIRINGRLEGEMYDWAHRDGWIPGLARPVMWSNPGISIQHHSNGGKVTILERHCVVLESIGSPLSGCNTVLDILKCMYDLLEGENDSLCSVSHAHFICSASSSQRKRYSSSRHQLQQRAL
jgi:hypothetical protein